VPFGLGRKKQPDVEADARSGVAASDRRGAREVRFDGLTEEWRLRGTMQITGRLIDTLNKREPVDIADVIWAPLGTNTGYERAPDVQSVDPYDVIVVVAGRDTQGTTEEQERLAQRVHKIKFDVALQVPPLRVIGSVQLNPGSEPDGLLERSSQMFVAVTNPSVWLGEAAVDIEDADAVLVNRFYMRGVEQVDLATGEKHIRLPGSPLGGTNWRERT
jgi:hypothetical protein